MALQNYAIEPMKTFLDGQYSIPNYQREYSWEENEIQDFLNDLEDTCANPSTIHFFGQIVVHNDEGSQTKFIIDGQQRTITSMIFVHSLQLLYENLYFTTQYHPASKKEVLLSNYVGEYSDEEKSLHLILSEADNPYFIQTITARQPSDSKETKKSWERIRKAFKTIYEYLDSHCQDASDTSKKMDCLNRYFEAFFERFKVMYIEATKLEEAFIIFETLNARGKDLETADLLKNFVFSKSKDVDDTQKKWNSIVDNLDKIDTTNYIRHYWNSSHKFIRKNDLYREIVKFIKTPADVSAFLDSLENCSQFYHDIAFPEENVDFTDDKLISCLKNLKILKAKTFYPILLAMKQAKESYSEKDLLTVAETIEVYVFRNFTICGKVANTGERFFSEIALRIYGDLNSVTAICKEIRKSIVPDDEFTAAFNTWSGSNREIIRYILRKINKQLSPTDELNLNNSDVHIEHVMPIENSKWKIPEDTHNEYLWRLGNLTLLSGKLNIQISNEVFPIKVSEYAKSKIDLNKSLCTCSDGTPRTKWIVPDDIDIRQKYFSDYGTHNLAHPLNNFSIQSIKQRGPHT